jgi:hypothetical protein
MLDARTANGEHEAAVARLRAAYAAALGQPYRRAAGRAGTAGQAHL